MKRKLVSFVLVGSMVTSLMPATALAGTENSEGIIAYSEPISVSTADELQQQITAASSGPVTIQLTSEITFLPKKQVLSQRQKVALLRLFL